MQFESLSKRFDTTVFSAEFPFSPAGSLFVYYPSESPAHLHYHNFLEIGYCEYGTGMFIVDNKVIPYTGKCVSVVYEGQIHIANSISEEKCLWHFLYIDLEKLFHGMSAEQLSCLHYRDYRNYSFPSVIPYENDATLYGLVTQILDESASCKNNYLPAIQGLVYTMLVLHGRYMVADNPGTQITGKSSVANEIHDLLEFISVNYTENITINDLCGVANMSKPTMQRKVLECTGFSPMQFIHHLRLTHAAVLLKDSALPISEIATRSGYNSISSFNRAFLKKHGISPSVYRKQ